MRILKRNTQTITKKSQFIKKGKRNRWKNGCASKRRFQTFDLADKQRIKLEYRHLLNIYLCEFCDYYHLGKSDKHHD